MKNEKKNYLKTGEVSPVETNVEIELKNMIETAVVDNRVSLLNFGALTKYEQNVFFVLVSFFKKNQQVIKIDVTTLFKMANLTLKRSFNNQVVFLNKTIRAIQNLSWGFIDPAKQWLSNVVIFPTAFVNLKTKQGYFELNRHLMFLFNNLDKNFIKLMMRVQLNLKSKYSSVLFLLMSKFNDTGELILSINEFRNSLNISEKYNWPDINRRILDPIKKEFKNNELIRNFKITKIVDKSKNGHPITHIKINFEPFKISFPRPEFEKLSLFENDKVNNEIIDNDAGWDLIDDEQQKEAPKDAKKSKIKLSTINKKDEKFLNKVDDIAEQVLKASQKKQRNK